MGTIRALLLSVYQRIGSLAYLCNFYISGLAFDLEIFTVPL